jgi:hypothetical protein
MRTFIAMILCGITSPTDWVNDYLKEEETHQNPKKQLKEDKQKVIKPHIKIVAKLADRFQRVAGPSALRIFHKRFSSGEILLTIGVVFRSVDVAGK